MEKKELVIKSGFKCAMNNNDTTILNSPYHTVDKTKNDSESIIKISTLYKEIIKEIDNNPERESLLKTPDRIAKTLKFLTSGYKTDPYELIKSAMFREDYHDMILVKGINMFSLCEHHMLPFFGKVHIAYIPKNFIVGISKLPRVVDSFARRLQVQERLTNQIKECIQEALTPLGVAVIIEARHLCMEMRGVQKQNAITTTVAFTGEFNKKNKRDEFIRLISTNND